MPGDPRRPARHRPERSDRRGLREGPGRAADHVHGEAAVDHVHVRGARGRVDPPRRGAGQPRGSHRGRARRCRQIAAGPAGAALRDFDGGRLWVSVAPVPQDTLVAATVALEVGVAIGTDASGAALAEHFAPLGRLLLVLDGCEAVIDGVASLAAELLAACPQLTLVVTSRVPLAIDSERILTVEPLPLPAADDPDRAARQRPGPAAAGPGS